MFIELKDLEIHPVDFREEFGPGVIDLGEEVRQLSPLGSEGRADLVEEHHGKHEVVQDIRIKGKLQTSVEVACARCLEPVVHAVERATGEPLDVYVNGTLIAHGEVVVVNDKFGIRLTDVISPAERIRQLK